jgi:predicted phage terminase large subunit-like protein
MNNPLSGINLGRLDLSKLSNAEMAALRAVLTPKMTKYIPHTPTPKQAAYMLLDCKEAFYGGAAGGGKSDALLMCALQYVDVQGYSAILFRKTYADLTKPGALMDRAKEWLLPHKEVRWDEKEKKFIFYRPGSKLPVSVVQFGYLENSNDRYNYQGGEYQFIGFDELTHISKDNYTYMFSRLRKLKGVNIPLRVRGASNPPDDDGGIWVKERFIDEGPSKGRIFIPAGLDDNPYLDKEEYERALDELDPVTRARLREGDWSITRKGNMFKRDWIEQVDVLPPYRRTVRWWDMAASDEEKAKKKNKSGEPDYTASLKVSEYQGIYYIEDIIRVRKNPEGTETLQHLTAVADGYNVAIREEQEPGSSGLAVISNKSRTIFKGYNYKGVPSTGSKVDRAQIASAAAGNGNIKIVRGCRNMEAFFNEMESFPGGIHDDMVDCLSGCIAELGTTTTTGAPITVTSEQHQVSHWLEDDADDVSANFGMNTGYFSRFGT